MRRGPNPVAANQREVLVVEDEPQMRELLTDNLEYEGYRVTAVGEPSFWSPDGKIVFAGRIGTPKNGQYQVYVMNPDGSGKRALLELGDGSFSWSPDGRMIAFRRHNGQVYVVSDARLRPERMTSS